MTRRGCHVAAALLLSCGTPALAQEVARSQAERPWYGDVNARLRLSHLYSDDLDTPDHLHFTDLRLNLDATSAFDRDFEVHVDGRSRHGWTEITKDRNDITRLFVQLGNRKSDWMLAIGRQVISAAFAARVDGAYAGLTLGSTQLGAFGGLKPHPLTAALDPDFTTAGLAYDTRSEGSNHAGGVVADFYAGEANRVYASERAYVRLSERWSLLGHLVVDFLSPAGILDELDPRQSPRDDFSGGLDLTHGNLMLRYRDRETFGVSLSGIHIHTILPNEWWRDWVREERARRGFVVDGVEPVGTRLSTVRLNSDWYLNRAVTPYLKLRFDRRHNDDADGWEGRPGVKVTLGNDAWIDVFYSWRQRFSAVNNHLSLSSGISLSRRSALEAHASFMNSRRRGEEEGQQLYDFGGLLRIGLGDVSDTLAGVDLITQYQGFLDPGTAMHVFFLQLGYRS